MNIEKQVATNTKDIKVLRHDVNNNTNRLDMLEAFILPELKIIGDKIDHIKIPWVQYIGLLAMGSVLTFAFALLALKRQSS